jgi:hypothetical protein
MQPIQYFNSSSSGCCDKKALMPVVYQKNQTIVAGTGATANELITIGEGECAAYGGQIVNNGCYNLKAVISYLKGDDCDECTVDTLTTESVELIIPKNSVFPIPDGYYQQIQILTVDASGKEVSNTTDQEVSYYSASTPSCTGCVKAIKNVVSPCGVGDSGIQTIVDDGSDVNDTQLPFDILGAGPNGFQVNVWSLDNNFNLSVNGENITTASQINFHSGSTGTYTGGVDSTFADGTYIFGDAPWDYPNDSAEPLIKIKISNAGVVTMEGWQSAGVYAPLVLTDGATFKTVTINSSCSQPNAFLFSQSTVNNPTQATVQILGV